MKTYKTLEVIESILKNPKLKYKTIIDGKEVIAAYNQNGGISVGRAALNMSKKSLNTLWELVQERYTFIEAINSNGRIKPDGWATFKPIQEILYDLMDYTPAKVIDLINGYWNIEKSIQS